ncbi:FAD/NAD(P)-binding oxidoreductase [Salinicoccus siamensis]|uniref:NAD(P)/FAD-dependent oxidoreductase n=1 Tax=Salinicoccus siamensis TaxID=381830 RepID=UPI00361DA13A
MYEKGPHISYGNCGMPYHIGGEVEKRDQLVAATPESFKERDVIVKTRHEVVGVDPDGKTVSVKNLEDGNTFEASYDHLVLSPGATPGSSLPLRMSLRHSSSMPLHHLDAIKSYIEENDIEHVVVVGAGYISLEMVENLVQRGIHITLVHRSRNIYKHLESDMNDFFQEELDRHGVEVKLEAEIEKVEGDTATLTTGEEIFAPMIIAGTGITPSTGFLEDSGITLNDSGHICTDDAAGRIKIVSMRSETQSKHSISM